MLSVRVRKCRNDSERDRTGRSLKRFEIDAERGLLPAVDPLDQLPRTFARWDELGRYLPKLLGSNHLRETLDRLPVLDVSGLRSERQRRRAMMLLTYFAH